MLSTQASFPASLLKWFGRQHITGFPGVPGHFSLFLGRYRARLAALGDHLRYILLGTAPTPSTLLADLRAVLPRTRIHKTNGSRECGRVTAGDFTDPGMPASAVGPPAPGVELIVRDENGRELPRGETGRVFISSDMVMKGYWGRPAENAELLEGGWFKTRDLGYIDDRGLVSLVGRVDAMINTGGEERPGKSSSSCASIPRSSMPPWWRSRTKKASSGRCRRRSWSRDLTGRSAPTRCGSTAPGIWNRTSTAQDRVPAATPANLSGQGAAARARGAWGPMMRELFAAIRAVFALPPAAVWLSCVALTWICYFVLPLAAGIPIVVVAALLPWFEERLTAHRGAPADRR